MRAVVFFTFIIDLFLWPTTCLHSGVDVCSFKVFLSEIQMSITTLSSSGLQHKLHSSNYSEYEITGICTAKIHHYWVF